MYTFCRFPNRAFVNFCLKGIVLVQCHVISFHADYCWMNICAPSLMRVRETVLCPTDAAFQVAVSCMQLPGNSLKCEFCCSELLFFFLRRSVISLRPTSVTHNPVVGRRILHHLRNWFGEP